MDPASESGPFLDGLRWEVSGVDQLVDVLGPLEVEEINGRQAAVATDDDEAGDFVFDQIADCRPATLARSEFGAASAPDDGSPKVEDAADRIPIHGPKMFPTSHEPTKPFGDGDDIDPLVEGGSHRGAERRVHSGSIASGREYAQAAVG